VGTEPQYVRGSEVRVGDIVCSKVGNQMHELLTVVGIETSETQGNHYVTLTGQGQSAKSALMADDRTWVLRND